jgi:uncharacterized membrane protein (DUF2068 family)
LTERQRFYLRLIAVLKVAKGLTLFAVAMGLLFLDDRPAWLAALTHLVQHEMLLPHGNLLLDALRWIDDVLTGVELRPYGVLALVYALVFLTEGTGVWFEQRWAEWLLVFATGGLIPLELYHLLLHPSLAKLALIAANVAMVAYLAVLLLRSGHRGGGSINR